MPFIQVFEPRYFFNLQNVCNCGLSYANVCVYRCSCVYRYVGKPEDNLGFYFSGMLSP